MGLRNKRPRQLVYSVRVKGVYSGRKVQNAMSHYKKLLKRESTEGKTLWIENAKEYVIAKFKKYGINPAKIS